MRYHRLDQNEYRRGADDVLSGQPTIMSGR